MALLADFLQNQASSLTIRGYQNYRDTARAYLAPVFKVPLLQFGEDDVRNLLSALTKRAPQCVRSAKSVLSCAFEYGKQHVQGIKLNPCTGVKVTVKKGKRERWLTDTELSSVLAALGGSNPSPSAIFSLRPKFISYFRGFVAIRYTA